MTEPSLTWDQKVALTVRNLESHIAGQTQRLNLASVIVFDLYHATIYAYPYNLDGVAACGAIGTYDGTHTCSCNYRSDFCSGHYHLCYCGSDWKTP